MSVDTLMVARIRGLTSVDALCVDKKIYHQQVLQDATRALKYPCLVYEISDDTPYMELAGPSGVRVATFVWNCYSEVAADIRSFAADIQALAGIVCTEFMWVQVDDTTDNYESPIDLQETGLKFAQLTMQVVYLG